MGKETNEVLKKVNFELGLTIAKQDQELDSLRGKIGNVALVLSEIEKLPEYQGFVENNLIPCKAPCARQYEELCKLVVQLKACLCENNITEGRVNE